MRATADVCHKVSPCLCTAELPLRLCVCCVCVRKGGGGEGGLTNNSMWGEGRVENTLVFLSNSL